MRLVKITFYSPDGGSISPILYKDKNYVMEDIDAYLNLAYGNISPNFLSEQLDINPLKEIEIKVKLDKEIVEKHLGGTYAKLQFTGNQNYYYFVDEYKSIAPNIVKYKLTMDELNTFYNQLEFTNKTMIIREHRNRFFYEDGYFFVRIIDDISEGLNPQLYNSSIKPPKLLDKSSSNIRSVPLNLDFYLLYQTNNTDPEYLANNAIKCFLYASERIRLKGSSPIYIQSVSTVDRTDSKNVKLIKLPYPPLFIYLRDDGTYEYDEFHWAHSGNENDTLQTTADEYLHAESKFESPYPISNYVIMDSMVISNHYLPKDIKYESKLYSSEFFNYKIMYDSFVYMVEFENLDTKNYLDKEDIFTVLSYEFTVTSTINSKFMFKFNLPLKYYSDDYQSNLVITRNNEMGLYSNTYLNYLRTGYNYDLKAKEQAITSSWINTGIGIASTVGGGIVTAVTGGAGSAIGVAGVVSGVNSVVNSINTMISQERNFQAKIANLKASCASVAGSDDVDLMSEYCENKLRIVISEPKEHIRNMIYDLFYYYGYQTKRFGIPDLNSRYWFNFIQCEPEFTWTHIANDILESIKEKFKNGVTIFHHHDGKYDVEQKYENWETDFSK